MGERSAKALADHAADIMPSRVKRLKTPEELAALLDSSVRSLGFLDHIRPVQTAIDSCWSPWILQRDKPTALLITNALLVTPLYKALSTDLTALDFHVIRDKGAMEDLKQRLGVSRVPSIMVLHPNQEAPVFFEGLWLLLL